MEYMNDEKRLLLAKGILQMHFGMRHIESGEPVCAGCCDGTPWPCAPVRLAEDVQRMVLAR